MNCTVLDQTFDEERALYHLEHARVERCRFEGPADGESALKEARDVDVADCSFSLRYPLWHTLGFSLTRCRMDEKTRAALWYATDGEIVDCHLGGVKALRECRRIRLTGTTVESPEFGWNCREVVFDDCDVTSEYFLMGSSTITANRLRLTGKYSFQYTHDVTVTNAVLNTKDAFWHAENVTVKDSVINGEYLGWYSDRLTLINCRIVGTQPLCYCKRLKLIDCTMRDADLAFEYSDVEADVQGEILSVKNPLSGHIVADKIGAVIRENAVYPCAGAVTERHP